MTCLNTIPGFICLVLSLASATWAVDRPNILWITSEDNGPHLGCYGDTYADTPHLDALAARGVIYRNAWSTAPVCAPARTTIISGVYPASLGAQHMRSLVSLPPQMKLYPQFLRKIGYYCTNNSKKDYNVEEPKGTWDVSSNKAHSAPQRQPGQPFFAIFNFTTTHESQIRKRPHHAVHDPAKVRIPLYHPDTPEVRQDWAQYYDKITEMDGQIGQVLAQLEEDGLTDDTLIFYYGDHGAGMPRSKRWPYDSGLRVPLIVHVPEKYQHLAPQGYQAGAALDRLVGFIDLAPTLLSTVGIEPPAYHQGHAFMGPHATKDPSHAFGFRGRMDECYDMVRTVRNKRYQYIRNFMPHKVYGQYLAYMFVTPTTQVLKNLYDAGRLQPPQTAFWETKPSEELYDLQTDPDQVHNLANDPAYTQTKTELQGVLKQHMLDICDLGLLPENEIHERSPGMAPYTMGHEVRRFNASHIYQAADLATSLDPAALPTLQTMLKDPDSAVRYWAAMGILMREKSTTDASSNALLLALDDPAPAVRIIAAQALGQYGSEPDAAQALQALMTLASPVENNFYQAMMALNAIAAMPIERVTGVTQALEALPTKDPRIKSRPQGYCQRLLHKILADLKATEQ